MVSLGLGLMIVGALVIVASGVGAARAHRARRGRAQLPRFELVPARGQCRVVDARILVAAWRAAGFRVEPRARRLGVWVAPADLVSIDLPRARRFGAEPIVAYAARSEAVAALAAVTAQALGPLACVIDGYSHGFDPGQPDAEAEADAEPAARRATAIAAASRATAIAAPSAVARAAPDAATVSLRGR